jgi:hypothetical protein
MWDAEALVQLGTARLPLKLLLRDGRERAEAFLAAEVSPFDCIRLFQLRCV